MRQAGRLYTIGQDAQSEMRAGRSLSDCDVAVDPVTANPLSRLRPTSLSIKTLSPQKPSGVLGTQMNDQYKKRLLLGLPNLWHRHLKLVICCCDILSLLYGITCATHCLALINLSSKSSFDQFASAPTRFGFRRHELLGIRSSRVACTYKLTIVDSTLRPRCRPQTQLAT